jgi:hypothetical protein
MNAIITGSQYLIAGIGGVKIIVIFLVIRCRQRNADSFLIRILIKLTKKQAKRQL